MSCCRPFLGFDGCHLNGPFGGMLLSAIALDGNLQFYPLSVAIVETKNKDIWKWFLPKLNGLISFMLENKKLVVILDKQKGKSSCFCFLYSFSL